VSSDIPKAKQISEDSLPPFDESILCKQPLEYQNVYTTLPIFFYIFAYHRYILVIGGPYMANLQAIFDANGLQGIVPYAFGMKGQGYQFLCQKLMEGIPFWVITAEDTGMPYVFAVDDRVMFGLFSTQAQAASKCDELAMSNFVTVPVYIDPQGWAQRLLKRYRDLGATHLLLDDSALVKISDIAPMASYDGIINPQTPLRNARLNAALYCLAQFSAAGIENNALVAYFWEVMKNSRLYAPKRPTRQLQPGEALTDQNSDFHYIILEDGKKAVLCFTDGEFVNIYAEVAELPSEDCSVASTPGHTDWKGFLDHNPGMGMVLNAGAGDFLFTQEIIREYELAVLNQSASDAGKSTPIY